MRTRRIGTALTGLAAGALLTAILLGVSIIGTRFGAPSIPYSVFEWLTRVLPGRLVIFGLETTLHVLEGLGLNIKNTAKTTEEVLALTGLLVAGSLAGLLFFSLVAATERRRVRRYGLALGAVLGVLCFVIALREAPATTVGGDIAGGVWIVGVLLLWGWALARMALVVAAPPAAEPVAPTATPAAAPPEPWADAATIDRRHFMIRVGGAVATFVVLGAELSDILKVESGVGVVHPVKAPIAFPNADSPVKPVPGTRLEYTPVADHYRVDIDLQPPLIDPQTWRLKISGLVDRPLSLTLDQLKSDYTSSDQFITLTCISNPLGGPLIGTTLWSGPPFRDVLASAGPQPRAHYAHLVSQDGFDEVVDLQMIQSDDRIVLAHAWNGQPLPPEHGFPLRVYVPDVYGMKQPKWITDVVLVADFIQGYWVKRGWDRTAMMRTTAVIDTVATGALVKTGGQTFVPVGGIAHAGDRGISKVEVQVDQSPWQPAELRAPLSGLTWVIWRYDWPFKAGSHVFAVRAYDGAGQLQVTKGQGVFPSGATGILTKSAIVT